MDEQSVFLRTLTKKHKLISTEGWFLRMI